MGAVIGLELRALWLEGTLLYTHALKYTQWQAHHYMPSHVTQELLKPVLGVGVPMLASTRGHPTSTLVRKATSLSLSALVCVLTSRNHNNNHTVTTRS